jgi:serine/threonine protein kinase
MHREAIIMESLTASPLIVDIFSHCGMTILAEHMLEEVEPEMIPHNIRGQSAKYGWVNQDYLDELQKEDVVPLNNLTNLEKIDMALVFAESLAEIHGFSGGVIMHGDGHPVQWLRAEDGSIKLNDFSEFELCYLKDAYGPTAYQVSLLSHTSPDNAQILDFDPVKGEYCQINRCFGAAYRAPEEFQCIDGDESVDVYIMGHMIYSLLTGLWPFYQYYDWTSHDIQDRVVHHKEAPFVDPRYRTRSMIERGLVEIMELCWTWDPKYRVSIFEVVEKLRELKASV